jgi:hypothetical protein
MQRHECINMWLALYLILISQKLLIHYVQCSQNTKSNRLLLFLKDAKFSCVTTLKGRGRDQGKLFPCDAAATASPTSPGRLSRRGEASPRQTLTPPLTTDGEHNIELGRYLPTLYTPAQQFPGHPPSPAPKRLPERRGADGIAAGSARCLLYALGNCSKGKGANRREKMEPNYTDPETRYCSKALHVVTSAQFLPITSCS